MAALDTYLITKDDILIYRPTAELDADRIKPFILEAQRIDLRPVLNDVLYYDFVSKIAATGDPMYTKYQNLLNGVSYTYESSTIQFDGIKPMLSLYALARFVGANPANITRFGIVVKTPQNGSSPADATIVKHLVNELRSAAMSYQLQAVQYLDTLSSDYPLYNTGGASENVSRKTSFNFFKA
jgi:hypothetical protein